MIVPQQLGSFEPLIRTSDGSSFDEKNLRPLVRCIDWTKPSDTAKTVQEGTVEFTAAWNVQKQLLQHHVERLPPIGASSQKALLSAPPLTKSNAEDPRILDTLILVEHSPVYTLGTGSDAAFIKQQSSLPSGIDGHDEMLEPMPSKICIIPTVRMDRGGEVTYHGPGQLTIYPVLNLRHYRQDIHWYVRALEEVVLVALRQCGVPSAVREADVTGIWVDDHKVAAVGVSCKKWITQHGVAINVTPESLAPFDGIVPCGLVGRRVGCVNQFLPPEQHVTVKQMAAHVKSAMEEVFQMQLVNAAEEDELRVCN